MMMGLENAQGAAQFQMTAIKRVCQITSSLAVVEMKACDGLGQLAGSRRFL